MICLKPLPNELIVVEWIGVTKDLFDQVQNIEGEVTVHGFTFTDVCCGDGTCELKRVKENTQRVMEVNKRRDKQGNITKRTFIQEMSDVEWKLPDK